MRAITRTIPVTVINCALVTLECAEPKLNMLEPVLICGSHVPEGECLQKVRKKYGSRQSYVITGVEYNERFYSMPVEEFMKHASLVEKGGNTEQESLDRQED